MFRDEGEDDTRDKAPYISLTLNGEIVTKFNQRFLDIVDQYMSWNDDKTEIAKFLSRYCPSYMQPVETVMPDVTQPPQTGKTCPTKQLAESLHK